MRKLRLFFPILILSIVFSCGSKSEQESKNMEQLYSENGVPVKTEKITKTPFETSLKYFSPLSGIRESSKSAMIGDKVEKIFFEVGDKVKKGQIVVAFPKDNPSAQYYQSRTAYLNAKKTYERMKKIHETGGVSQQDMDNIESQYKIMKANWLAVQKAVSVKSPLTGYITKINVNETDNVKPGDLLFTVSNMRKLKAKIWVSENDICEVKKDLNASAVWKTREITGKVKQVDMSLNKDFQAFGVTLEFDNPDKIQFCGITADIFIKTYQTDEAVVISRKNILRENSRDYVYIAENESAKKRFITTGKFSENKVEVLEGLNPGDMMITEGQMLLEDGTKIKVVQ